MTPKETKARKSKERRPRKKQGKEALIAQARYLFLKAKNGPDGFADLEAICEEAKEGLCLLLCITGTCGSPEEARELMKRVAKECREYRP